MQNPTEIADFARLALLRYGQLESPGRLLISVSGIPGSGKTTFANAVVHKINELTQLQHGIAAACVLSMDGYHFPRNSLASFPNPEEACRRRGAPFTFNVQALLELLKRLRAPSFSTIHAPSFDHSIKDPIHNDVSILGTQKIVVVEGNYLCFYPPMQGVGNMDFTYPSPLWHHVAALFHEKWVVDTPLEIASSRLALRHLAAGIVNSLEEGYQRANGSDRQNSDDILRWRGCFDQKVSTFSL